MAAWSSGVNRPGVSDLDALSRVLEAALLIAPDNPDHYEDMARLALLRSGMPGTAGAARSGWLRQGLVSIRRAIALRPASPYDWAVLLRLKSESGEYDAEFRRSLERTVTLGPWEPGLQGVVLDAGLNAWDVLPVAEREMVRESYHRGLKRQAGAMLDVIFAHRNGCVVSTGYDGCVQ